jgi:hypothetical protein
MSIVVHRMAAYSEDLPENISSFFLLSSLKKVVEYSIHASA